MDKNVITVVLAAIGLIVLWCVDTELFYGAFVLAWVFAGAKIILHQLRHRL